MGAYAISGARSDCPFAATQDPRDSDERRHSPTRMSVGADTGGSKTCEEYVGRVSLNEDQQLLHRAVGHLYSKIIQCLRFCFLADVRILY